MRAIRLVLWFALAAALAAFPALAAEVKLVHVHGLSYSPDGKQLLIPSHFGLAIYSGGRWSKAPGPEHDFMGFSVARDAMYSSGHPAPGSSLRNPFGLMKSTDGGKTWQNLGLLGEADFHTMTTSYGTGVVYVFNRDRNSAMQEPGIYSTLDDGKTWKRSEAKGLSGRVLSLAVHPLDARKVAVATDVALYLSQDAGAAFRQAAAGQVTSAHFDLDGMLIWFGSYDKAAKLSRLALNGLKAEPVKIPVLIKDAVSFIAQNPERKSEIAIATFNRSVYLSADAGKSWKQIAAEGETRHGP
jgi:hypothetical protein